jgi:Carboxypeptidase regulatory-like domain
MKSIAVLLCAGVAGLGSSVMPRAVDACSCARGGDPCQELDRSDTVFTGRVDAVEQVQDDAVYTIEVSEVFLGNPSPVVKLHAGHPTMCGLSLTVGKDYVVYAATVALTGELLAPPCSRTRLLSTTTEGDLRFLRSLPTLQSATVEGTVTFDGAPRAGAVVRAHRTPYSTTTDTAGRYRLDLPTGHFAVEVDEPAAAPLRQRVALRRIGACVRASFPLRWNGRISGRVVDAAGKPVANVQVQARRAVGDQSDQGNSAYVLGPHTRTDANGEYELTSLAEGAYVVVVGHRFDPDEARPTTYYPGVADRARAKPVTVARAELAAGIDFALPAPYRMRQITVHVIRGAAPLGSDELTLRNPRAKREQLQMTNAAGDAVLREQDGAEIQLSACNGVSETRACSEIATVKLTKDVEVTLELKSDLPMPRLP